MVTVSRSHDEVVACERELLTSSCRADPGRVAGFLHDDFREFGASGRAWSRAALLESLGSESDVEGEAVDVVTRDLADGVVLLTYRIDGPRPSLRSSVWVRVDGTWRMLFHQGTLVRE